MRRGHRLSAAMLAGQAASLGHLPVDQHWISGKILGQTAHIWSSPRNHHDVSPPTTSFRAAPQPSSGYFWGGEKAVIWITAGSDGAGSRGQGLGSGARGQGSGAVISGWWPVYPLVLDRWKE